MGRDGWGHIIRTTCSVSHEVGGGVCFAIGEAANIDHVFNQGGGGGDIYSGTSVVEEKACSC